MTTRYILELEHPGKGHWRKFVDDIVLIVDKLLEKSIQRDQYAVNQIHFAPHNVVNKVIWMVKGQRAVHFVRNVKYTGHGLHLADTMHLNSYHRE